MILEERSKSALFAPDFMSCFHVFSTQYSYHCLDLFGGLEHFFIFPYIGNHNPKWLYIIFLRGVETTNQNTILGRINDAMVPAMVLTIVWSILPSMANPATSLHAHASSREVTKRSNGRSWLNGWSLSGRHSRFRMARHFGNRRQRWIWGVP